jgi:hypothetical protein
MQQALCSSWSPETSTLYSEANPARGQCSVTALAVQRLLGGEILKTRVGGAWHFYNRVEGRVIDFTAEQFDDLPEYLDVPATRADALSDTSPEQYSALIRALSLQGFDK